MYPDHICFLHVTKPSLLHGAVFAMIAGIYSPYCVTSLFEKTVVQPKKANPILARLRKKV